MTNTILTLYDSLAGMQQSADSLHLAIDSIHNLRAIAAADSNATIVPTNDIEEYYKTANDVYLHTIAQDDSAFDSIQLASLYQLAFLCPLKGGKAVFKARSMLSLVIDTTYDDDALCAVECDRMMLFNVTDSAASDTARPIQVKMYPNPSRDYVILAANQDLNGPIQLKITDALAGTVMSMEINMSRGYYLVDTSPFASGLYYVTLYGSTNELFGGKLTIFRK